jgi:hypothetical protein
MPNEYCGPLWTEATFGSFANNSNKIGLGSEHVLRNITIIEKSKNDGIITIKSFPTLSSDPIQGFMENGTFSLTVWGGNWLNMPVKVNKKYQTI